MEKNKIKNNSINTKKIAYAVILTAIGIALSPFTSIPIGIAKINPTQHFVNLIGAVLLGPWWSLLIAFIISVIRNLTGLGTILAFPGSMIGALLAGLTFRYFKNIYLAGLGEVLGTGIIGSLLSAYIIAPFIMKKSMGVISLLLVFILSSIAGNILALLSLKTLEKSRIIDLKKAI